MKKYMVFIFVLALITACEESPNETENPDVEAQIEDAQMVAGAVPVFIESSMTGFAAMEAKPDLAKKTAAADTLLPDVWTCPYLIWDETARTLLLDFGYLGCRGKDGRTRSGSITLSLQGRLVGGVSLTLSYDDYQIEQTELEGDVTVTGKSDAVNVVIAGGKIKNANGTWFVDADLSVTAVLGDEETLDDDYYMIEGSGTVTDAEDNKFDFTITEPLSMSINCEYPMQGKMQVSGGMTFTAGVDYYPEEGDCDDIAEITIGKTSRTVHLGGMENP